jgi:hypothetical protein
LRRRGRNQKQTRVAGPEYLLPNGIEIREVFSGPTDRSLAISRQSRGQSIARLESGISTSDINVFRSFHENLSERPEVGKFCS